MVRSFRVAMPLYIAIALFCSCTTVTRSDGTQVRIPAGGFVGSMAATNIACEDNVKTLLDDNAKLRARVTELEAKLAEAQKANTKQTSPTPPRQ